MVFNFRTINLLSSYFASGFSAFCSICIMFIINYSSGVAFYGDLMVYLSLSTILFSFFSFGTRETVTKIMKNHNDDISVMLSGFLLDLLSSLTIIVVIYFFGEKILAFFYGSNINTSYLNKLLAAYTVFFICQSSFIGFLKCYEKIIIISFASIFQNIVKVSIIAFYIINESETQTSIISAFVMGSFGGLIFLIFGTVTSLKFKINKFSLITFMTSFGKLYNLSKLYFLASLSKFGYKNFENLLLIKFLGNEAVGVYQTLLKALSPIILLTAPIGANYQRVMMDLYIENKKEKLKNIIIKISKIVLSISSLYILIVMFMINYYLEVQEIHKIEYSFLIISVLGTLYLIQSSTWWSGNFMINHFPQLPIYTNILASILNLLIPFYALYYYGNYGLIIFSIALLVCKIPTWIIPFVVFNNYLKKS